MELERVLQLTVCHKKANESLDMCAQKHHCIAEKIMRAGDTETCACIVELMTKQSPQIADTQHTQGHCNLQTKLAQGPMQ